MKFTDPHLALFEGMVIVSVTDPASDEGDWLELVSPDGTRPTWGGVEAYAWEQLGIETEHIPFTPYYQPEATSLRKAINKAGIDFPQEIK